MAILTLRETATRNEAAKDLLGLQEQAKANDAQRTAIRSNIANLMKAVAAEDIFSDEDEAEVRAVYDECSPEAVTRG